MSTNQNSSGIYVFRVGILALHKTLSDLPRDPLVVAAFSLAVHSGGNLLEAVNIARMINKPHDVRFPELLDLSGLDAEALEAEVLDLVESVRGTLLQMTNEYFVSQAMANYPQAPHSDLVSMFVSFSLIFMYTSGQCYPVDAQQ